ncbi:hypothetical protein ACS0TY_027036 [Phlomoides rotata]
MCFVYAVSVFSKMSDEALEMKLQSFRQLGFLDIDVLAMFRKELMVLHLSAKKFKSCNQHISPSLFVVVVLH